MEKFRNRIEGMVIRARRRSEDLEDRMHGKEAIRDFALTLAPFVIDALAGYGTFLVAGPGAGTVVFVTGFIMAANYKAEQFIGYPFRR